MKTYPYFPGCTLTNKAKGLGDTALACSKLLGIELRELDNWYCCQADFSSVTDNIMNHLGPLRTIISAKKQGDKLVTLCSTCYYVLKRVNFLMEQDPDRRKVAFEFLEEEYTGPIEIIHFLELIRDEVGFDKLKEKVKVPLDNFKVAPYYGCQLLRLSKELRLDDLYAPTIFEGFINALGAKVIDYSFKTECCGSFLVTAESAAVNDCVYRILKTAKAQGAEVITTSCPLCNFNLDWSQSDISRSHENFKKVPVLYLTELMALALDVPISDDIWDEHIVDARPLLKQKGLIAGVKKI